VSTKSSLVVPGSTGATYEQDLYEWAVENARLLRERRFSEIDAANIAEELEDMGKSERRALFSHLRNLLLHLLKWQYQPERRGTSWTLSIRNTRDEIEIVLQDSPSLRDAAAQSLETAYAKARSYAATETGIAEETFPRECPYSLEQILDDNFLPRD
jgi:hypothetical protein